MNKVAEDRKKPLKIKKATKAFTLLVTMLLIWGSANALFRRRENNADFFWIWFGNNAILEQTNPYTKESTIALQKALSGSEISPEQYQHPFPFPAFGAFILFPLGLLPYSSAYHIWLSLQFPMLFAALSLMKGFLGFNLHWIQEHFLFFACSIGFFYPIVVYALGQVSIFIFLLFSLLFYFSSPQKPILSAICLVFIAIRPDIFILACITLIVILWGQWQSLFRTGLFAFVFLLVLNLATLPLIGFWYFDWYKVIQEYSSHNPLAHYPIEMFSNPIVQITIIAITTTYLAWQVLRFIKRPTGNEKLLLISILVIVYLLANKLTGTYHLTLLLIPALIIFHFYSQSKLQFLVWITIFSPWIYWLFPSNTRSNDWISSLVVPLCFLSLQIVYSLFLSPVKRGILQPFMDDKENMR